VTSADVNILGGDTKLEGETLHLSLPLARILTLEEIKGITGHELGHFRGADTYYSLKFRLFIRASHTRLRLSGVERRVPVWVRLRQCQPTPFFPTSSMCFTRMLVLLAGNANLSGIECFEQISLEVMI